MSDAQAQTPENILQKADSTLYNTLPALFWFWILAVMAAFTEEIGGCQVRQFLDHGENRMVAKHTLGLVMMYYMLMLAQGSSYDYSAVVKNIVTSVVLYLVFVVMTHMPFLMIAISLVLMAAAFQIYNIREQLPPNSQKRRQQIIRYESILSWTVVGVVILGFIMYYMQQVEEHHEQFSFTRFFIGSHKCEHLN